MTHRRRTVLTAVAGGLAGLAGCSLRPSRESEPPATATPVPPPTDTPGDHPVDLAPVADGSLFVSGHRDVDGERVPAVSALDAETSEEDWRFEPPLSIPTHPVVADDVVYVGSRGTPLRPGRRDGRRPLDARVRVARRDAGTVRGRPAGERRWPPVRDRGRRWRDRPLGRRGESRHPRRVGGRGGRRARRLRGRRLLLRDRGLRGLHRGGRRDRPRRAGGPLRGGRGRPDRRGRGGDARVRADQWGRGADRGRQRCARPLRGGPARGAGRGRTLDHGVDRRLRGESARPHEASRRGLGQQHRRHDDRPPGRHRPRDLRALDATGGIQPGTYRYEDVVRVRSDPEAADGDGGGHWQPRVAIQVDVAQPAPEGGAVVRDLTIAARDAVPTAFPGRLSIDVLEPVTDSHPGLLEITLENAVDEADAIASPGRLPFGSVVGLAADGSRLLLVSETSYAPAYVETPADRGSGSGSWIPMFRPHAERRRTYSNRRFEADARLSERFLVVGHPDDDEPLSPAEYRFEQGYADGDLEFPWGFVLSVRDPAG